jgi:hypothetical protein
VLAIEFRGIGQRFPVRSELVVTFDSHDVQSLVDVDRAAAKILGFYLKLADKRLGFTLRFEKAAYLLARDVVPGYLPLVIWMISIRNNGDFGTLFASEEHDGFCASVENVSTGNLLAMDFSRQLDCSCKTLNCKDLLP